MKLELNEFDDSKWSDIKKIPKDTADRLSGILVDVASEIGLMSDEADCVICKLHMSAGNPSSII